MKRSSRGNHQPVQKNHGQRPSVEKDYSPYITFARGLFEIFNQTRAFARQTSLIGQGNKFSSTSQFPFKTNSPLLSIVKGLAGTVNELKKGVKYVVQMLENAIDKNETGPESEEWFYENTEPSDTVEDRRKPTSSVLVGVTPRSIRRLRRKKKLEKARIEKLKRRKLSKKKKRRKKKH